MPSYEQMAKEAEADINSYQNKTGNARHEALDEAGVNSMVEKKFDGAEVLEGDELSTNRGYDKRIPPSEGGVLDDKGRQPTGEDYDGKGGPIDKALNKDGGKNDNDVVPPRS